MSDHLFKLAMLITTLWIIFQSILVVHDLHKIVEILSRG